MSWSKGYKKSINCSNPKGFSQKAHCAGRKTRQRGEKTQSKSVSEMKISQLKEQIRKVIRERFINESSHKLGSEQYTKKPLSPNEIHSLAMEYLNTSVNKMYGSSKKMDSLINVANDLARLTGTTQQSHVKRGNPALLLQILKNNLVDKNEYIKLYRELIKKQESVIKTLKNADPASRMVGGAAARQAYKDMKGEFEESVNEAITNPKKTNPNDLAKTVLGWFDFYTDYIDDGGQRRRALKSNDDVLVWFGSHPKDVKEKAYKIMLSQSKDKGQIERNFGKHLKESVNEGLYHVGYNKGRGQGTGVFKDSYSSYKDAKKAVEKLEKERGGSYNQIAYYVSDKDGKFVRETVNESENFNGYVSSSDGKTFTLYNSDKKKIKDVSFDDLKNKYMKTYLGQKLKDFKDSFDKTTSKGKYFQWWKGKLVNVKLSNIDESINEATEPEVISQLRDIVKTKQYQDVKDPSSGKKMKVDMQTANTVLKIYDGLSNVNKQSMIKMGLPKMIDVSNKIISKYR